jgi:molybdate transport system substrate-binding protein
MSHRRATSRALGLVLAAVAGVAGGAAACSAGASRSDPGVPAGNVTVFAAASLTESFADVQTALRASSSKVSVTYSFAGSGALVTQVQQGAPADVVATADTASMQKLVDEDLVEPPVTFARSRLQILVAPGNPLGIHTLADLARADVLVVTEEDTVPAGRYAAQALAKAGVTVDPVSKEPDVKSAVAKVTNGEVDATIVYRTDVLAAGAAGEGVDIPEAQNVIAEYPIAIVKGTGNHDAAAAFVELVVEGEGQRALREHGFLPVT